MKIKGIDEVQRRLRQLSERAQALDGTHEVSVNEILTPDFIQAHTRYASVDEWFEASPFKIATTEDFAAIPDEHWNDYVRTTTDFESWQEMLEAAGAQYVQAKLFG
jgi:hypothetical protein